MSTEDIAQEVEAAEWARNNRVRTPRAMFSPGSIGYGPAECESCEIEMPDLRRAMGSCLCVDCTEREDLRKKIQGA